MNMDLLQEEDDYDCDESISRQPSEAAHSGCPRQNYQPQPESLIAVILTLF